MARPRRQRQRGGAGQRAEPLVLGPGGFAARRHDTAVGAAVHHASSLFWAAIYALLQSRRRPQPVADALALTAVAAVVDLKLVPARLTPGFEQRLSRRSLAWVYGGFAAGLVLGAALVGRRA